MSTPKPHRRLSITRPTVAGGTAAPVEPPSVEARVAELERRCEALESLVARLLKHLEGEDPDDGAPSEPAELEESQAVRVTVRDTGGGLNAAASVDATSDAPDPQVRRGKGSLASFDRRGRKAVAIYAEGPQGAVRVYDDGGDCVYSQQ